ncbi:MAG: choice-of-anchor A family protein [Candidatus Eisenbacteria bacterium]
MKKYALVVTLAAASGLFASPAAGESPFGRFAVFSLGDIGNTEQPYHSDFQGVGAAAGSAVFFGMSLNDLGLPAGEVSFFAGGDFTFTGSIRHGGVEAGGEVTMMGVSIEGDLKAGGDVAGNGGSIDGDVEAAGSISLTSLTVGGETKQGEPFSPTEDLGAASEFFLERSDHYASLAPTGTPDIGGQVVFDAGPGRNVFEIAASDMDAAWGAAIRGPAGATIIVNVLGVSGALTNMDWQVTGGAGLTGVLVHFPEATSLEIQGVALFGNILAPRAATYFPAGLVVGGLWVGDLQGGGQVNYGTFVEPDETPTSTHSTSWGAIKKTFR